MKKRAITLIELFVALGLASIILSILFSYFVQTTRIDIKISSAKKEVLERQYLQTKLKQVFASISYPADSKKNTMFLSSKNYLYFFFDNQIDPDPDFSGKVMGKLAVNKEKKLILSIYSKNKKRKETILNNVNQAKYDFLIKDSNKYLWKTSIPDEDLPYIIKISLNNDFTFAFFIDSEQTVVTYLASK